MQNSGQPDFHTHVQSPDSRAGTWDLPGLYCPSEPSSGLTCEVGFNLEGFFFYREAERAWKHCRSSKAVSLKKLVKTSLALAKQTKQGEKQAKTNHTKPRTEVCFFLLAGGVGSRGYWQSLTKRGSLKATPEVLRIERSQVPNPL